MLHNTTLSVLIINYNGEKVVGDCLRSVLISELNENIRLEVVVVDNASSDTSINILRGFPQAKLKISQKNLGFAGGCNFGLSFCTGEYVYILNNDATVTKNAISTALEFIQKHQDVGIVGSLILNKNKVGCIDIAGSSLLFNGFLEHNGIGDLARSYTEPQEFFSIKGVGFLFAKSLLSEVGYLFDDRYFAYLEETDLCWRTSLAGKRVILLPQSIIEHEGGHTSTRLNVEFIEFNSFKNRTCNLLKNLSLLEMSIFLPLHLATLVFIVTFFVVKKNFVMAKAVLKSIGWNIKNFQETLRYRQSFFGTKSKPNSLFGVETLKKAILPDFKKNLSYLRKYRNTTEKNV